MQIIQRYKPYFKQILALSYPIIIGQLGIVLMGVADIVMIGKLDPVNLAAASLANSVYFFICILGIGTLTAVSPLVAKSKGAGHPNQCAILYRQSIWAAILLSLFISGVLFILTENLDWFKQTNRVTELTKNYLHVLNIGTLPMLLFLAIKQYSDGLSYTKPSAIITLLALLLNILLNWILIFGHWGAPKLELFGAGIATSLSRIIMALAMFLYVKYTHFYKPYLRLKQHEHDRKYLIQIFKIGLPSGFQYFFEIGAFAFAAIMIGWISEFAMAAHQVAINIASVTYMLATGISAGGSIAVGDALGRKNKKDLTESGRAALIMGAIFMGACALVMALFAPTIIGFYTNDAEVAHMAIYLLYIAALFQLSDGIQCVGLGVLRGIGDTKIPTLITIIAYWGIGIPFGYFFGFNLDWSLYGVWFALLLGLSFSAVFLSTRFLKESRELDMEYHSTLQNEFHAH
ncbi:MAG: MATE family efflux transporter [Bacteroidia bacterium]|nr:MATE family efflux transporter [Bacteroidia bacterium]MCF8427283.1 MATE family efflux transporter [Bacteroidia bacterium]MCF8447415.1 MATE family efflux transporter [Bacteroidia bacterium]